MKHLLTFSTCLLLMLCSIVSYANLDDNFIYLGEHNNSTYYCSNTSDFTWHEARVAAQTYGGHLAIVDDAAENEFIRNSIMSDYIWLGLTDENSEGNYYDVFGNSCQYYNWNAGEPNNSNGEEHFVRLLKSNGQWTDRNASFLAEFVVEIPNAPTAPTPTGNVCTTRSANNVINCNNDLNYGGWLKIAGYTTSYNVSNANLVEYSDGTAVFTGTWTNHDDNNLVFDFEIWASGKTDVAPANSPKTHSCLTPDYNEFYYYTDFDGILYGKNFAEGAQIVIATYGAAFQLGVGANATGTENTFGASAWYSGYLTQQPTNGNSITLNTSANGHLGDINIQLSGGVDDCDNPPTCDGEISSIMLTNGSESVTLENGGTYQICELPTDNYLEAVVNGSHESFKFTVNGVDRTENSEPYNYPSVSNGETWNPQPDTYTIVSQLYAENNLGGLLCNEETIQITIEDCSPCYQLGGDSDNDGICDNDDCAPNNADLPTTPGTACDDNNNNTITDVIQADACTCAGTVPTNVCVKYKVSDSTPECGPFPNEAGVFFRRDCPSPTFEVWKAGDDLMLEERGDGTAVLTGSVYNGAIIGIVNIEYWAYSSTGTNWTNTCYNDQMNEDYFYNHFEGTISIDGIEYTLVEKGASFVFGEGANNESTGEFGFGGWLDGTWGNCVESFGKLTPIVPGSTCDDGNPETENDVIGADGCTCAGIVDPCILDELVTVSYEDLLCENTGAITFNFVDESDRTQIAFSLDGGSTWKSNIQDNLGSVTYADLVAGTYELMTRWGNGDCPTTLESVVIQGNGASPVATVSSTDTNCGGSDGSITFTFENAPNRSQIAFSLDGGSTWEANVADNSGSKIYENLAEGTYDLSIRWGDTDCPTSLGQVTLSYGNIGTTCDDGDACTTGDVYDAACNCVGTFADADNDGVCDANDICEGSDDTADADGDGTPDGCDDCDAALEGTTCNDGDDCTTGDVYDADCNCAGTFADSDNDGVCDANDICEGSDDTADADGDGTPDGCDDCDAALEGTTCNDGDDCTTGDVYDAACNCAGTFADADNDGVCDANDICEGSDDTADADGDGTPDGCDDCDAALEGTTCNDGDDCTTGDVYDAACNCAGTFADADNDGVCDADDCAPNNADLPTTVGTACNDNDPTTENDVIQSNGCDCAGTEIIIPGISIDDVIVSEQDGTAVLNICLDEATTVDVTVDFATANDSALEDADYLGQSGTITIEAGELCAMVIIELVDDANPEDTEELVVNLSNPTGAELVDDQGTVTILDTDVIVPSISIDDVIVNEEDGTAVLTICSDVTSIGLIVVDFTTSNGSAIDGVDYAEQSGIAVIPSGELCTMITIDIIDDASPESTEELVVNLSNVIGAVIADDQGTITILDTDATPLPSLDINDITVNEEDGIATLEICLDAVSDEAITVDFATADDSANEGSDYTGISGTLTIEAGELCAAITIPLVDDATPEETEELVVNLSNVIGAVIADDQGTVTILDTDATPLPSLDINDITVNEEDGTATLEICLDAVSDEAITVDFATADDSANEGSDYTGISGTLTIEAGELCAAITIPLVDDATPEETEELVVNLSNPIGAVIADDQGTVTILDTDVEASNCDDITITEADGTITTAGYDSPIVFIKVYDSNWNNVFDSGMITDNAAQSVSGLPAGEYWVFVKAYDMSWNELCDIHETITIEGVIGNDPNLAINDITVNEEDGTATLEICLDEVSDEAITVDFATADDSANEGSDYTGVSGTLTIEAGELCAAITIPLVDDATPESTEELVINLSNPTGANLADDQGVITILDTDVLGNDPLIAINDITINEEDGLATLAICLDAIADEDVTVDYATTNGSAIAGDDYIASTGTVTIPAGMLCMIIDLPILDDNNPESTETFEVILSNPNGGSIYDGTGIVTILDTDTPADGCSAISIEANDAVITVGGYSDPIVFVKVYDGNWDLVYNSGMLTNNETQTITVTETDTYWVFVKTYDTNWNQLCDKHEVFNVICHGADLCADLGGDTDGDGVCDDNDLCPGFDDNIDTNNNGIPDACDTVDPELCIEREVSSTDLCVGDTDYSFFIRFENTHYYYQFTDAATFTEYTDGTALLTGTIQNNEIPSLQFEVEVLYSGRTIDAPAESPKEHVCLSVDTDMFYFYPSLTGTLTGIDGAEGAVITMTEFGPAFQVGLGGNVTSTTDDFGGSGWMTMEVVNQPTTGSPLSFESSTSGEGDVNIMLTGGYEECLDVAITAPTTGGTENSSCNVEITSGDGTLSIGGYTQPVAIIQVFDNQWTPVFSCMGDCTNPLVIDDLETGTYFVKVSLYDENWIMECGETEGYYGVVNSLGLETQGAEFLFFTAAKDGNDVTLNWTTNTEYKNDYFVVERSIDGLNFETAFDVSSIRDNDAAVYYTDKDASPLRGKSFYRLKQVYDNGTYRYSNIKPIEFELGLLDFTVYPNPTTDKVFINLKEFEGEAASVVINNALGAEMMTFNTEALTRDAIEFNVSDLQAGMYSITAKMEGRKQLTRLFVIAKK